MRPLRWEDLLARIQSAQEQAEADREAITAVTGYPGRGVVEMAGIPACIPQMAESRPAPRKLPAKTGWTTNYFEFSFDWSSQNNREVPLMARRNRGTLGLGRVLLELLRAQPVVAAPPGPGDPMWFPGAHPQKPVHWHPAEVPSAKGSP